jgi:nitrogen regulatory protein P-II 1
LHDNSCLDEILNAWEEIGVSGITILPGTGLARLRQKSALRDDLPLIPSLEDLVERVENTNRTLFTIVKHEDMVDKIVAATQKVTGDLNLPNTSLLVVLPVLRAYGLDRQD